MQAFIEAFFQIGILYPLFVIVPFLIFKFVLKPFSRKGNLP